MIIVVTLPEWIGPKKSKLSVCHQNGLPKKFKVQEPRERVGIVIVIIVILISYFVFVM